MSRSRRRTPIAGNTIAESEKSHKRAAHRRERQAMRQRIHHETDPLPVLANEVSNPWLFSKDGKQWIDAPYRERKMRK